MIVRNPQNVLEVENSTDIKASSKVLWTVITTAGILEYCHPFCKKNDVKVWPGEGSEDSIEYFNGRILKREFTRWRAEKGYTLLIGEDDYASAKVNWTIRDYNGTTSSLTINIDLYIDESLGHYSKFIRRIIGRLYLVPKMRAYLKSVVLGFKHYVETDQNVTKNQFGYNALFSTR